MKNKYKIDGDTLIVYNRKDNRKMLFDAEDYDFVSQHTWCIAEDKETGYEWIATSIKQSSGKRKVKTAHRLLMNEPEGMLVDHYNGNPLDNRKSNLRIGNHQINNHNQMKAKGYYWDKVNNKWLAYITVNKKGIHLGRYKTENEARVAYLEAKRKYHPTAPHHLYK